MFSTQINKVIYNCQQKNVKLHRIDGSFCQFTPGQFNCLFQSDKIAYFFDMNALKYMYMKCEGIIYVLPEVHINQHQYTQ
jgi:hypothetical protein